MLLQVVSEIHILWKPILRLQVQNPQGNPKHLALTGTLTGLIPFWAKLLKYRF